MNKKKRGKGRRDRRFVLNVKQKVSILRVFLVFEKREKFDGFHLNAQKGGFFVIIKTSDRFVLHPFRRCRQIVFNRPTLTIPKSRTDNQGRSEIRTRVWMKEDGTNGEQTDKI